jgi:hypothetical protein
VYSAEFLKVLLNSLRVWGKEFYMVKGYVQSLDCLKREGVTFPQDQNIIDPIAKSEMRHKKED